MRHLLMLFTLLMVIGCGQNKSTKMKSNLNSKIGTIEVVLFKTKEGVSKENFTKAAAAVNPVMENLDGYLGRNLAVDPDGNWVDMVYWTDLLAAEHAAEVVMKSESCQRFIGMIDDSSMKFMHLSPVLEDQ